MAGNNEMSIAIGYHCARANTHNPKIPKEKVNIVFITSTDVVLLDTRDACMIMKQRRLSAKAKFRTASRFKEHNLLETSRK